MELLAISRLTREVLARLARSLPSYIAKALIGFLRWYWRQGLVGMFFVTVGLGVTAIIGASAVGLSAHAQAAMRHTVEPVLVAWLLLVIIVGMVRPDRRSR